MRRSVRIKEKFQKKAKSPKKVKSPKNSKSQLKKAEKEEVRSTSPLTDRIKRTGRNPKNVISPELLHINGIKPIPNSLPDVGEFLKDKNTDTNGIRTKHPRKPKKHDVCISTDDEEVSNLECQQHNVKLPGTLLQLDDHNNNDANNDNDDSSILASTKRTIDHNKSNDDQLSATHIVSQHEPLEIILHSTESDQPLDEKNVASKGQKDETNNDCEVVNEVTEIDAKENIDCSDDHKTQMVTDTNDREKTLLNSPCSKVQNVLLEGKAKQEVGGDNDRDQPGTIGSVPNVTDNTVLHDNDKTDFILDGEETAEKTLSSNLCEAEHSEIDNNPNELLRSRPLCEMDYDDDNQPADNDGDAKGDGDDCSNKEDGVTNDATSKIVDATDDGKEQDVIGQADDESVDCAGVAYDIDDKSTVDFNITVDEKSCKASENYICSHEDREVNNSQVQYTDDVITETGESKKENSQKPLFKFQVDRSHYEDLCFNKYADNPLMQTLSKLKKAFPFKDHLMANCSDKNSNVHSSIFDVLSLDSMTMTKKNPMRNGDLSQLSSQVQAPEEPKLYFDTTSPKSKLDIDRNVKNLMKKSVLKDDLEKMEAAPKLFVSKNSLKAASKKKQEETAGKGWYNLPKTEVTDKIKNDLQLIKMRNVLDPKHHYKRNDSNKLPKYFQIGTVVEGAHEYYSARVPKGKRKKTMVDELLDDAEFRRKNKKKYIEIRKKQVSGGKGFYKKLKDKKKATWERT